MEQRRLGTSGLKVSAIGLGCNNFGMRISAEETQVVVDAALDNGITFFDTADVYGGAKSEEFLGAALKGKRDKAVLATKFAMGEGAGGSRRYVVSAVEASLKRLGTDRIDLYQMHRADPDTPIEETLRALDDLVRDGKVLYLGNSNFTGWQIADADWISKTQGLERFVSAQNNYSLLERNVEREVLPACEKFGLGFLPFFPLASGLLSGKYSRGEAPPEGMNSFLKIWIDKQLEIDIDQGDAADLPYTFFNGSSSQQPFSAAEAVLGDEDEGEVTGGRRTDGKLAG
ncbi:MAG: aldo/keto reductase, partial [Pseudomonadota bacterium]